MGTSISTIDTVGATPEAGASDRARPGAAGVLDLESANRALDGAQPADILRWAVDALAGRRLALVSAFGPGSTVLIHLLSSIAPRLPVIFIDTLHHFPETLEHVEQVRERYDLDLRIYRPAESREAFEARHGPRLWERDLDAYQEAAKVEPFRRATAELDAWFTGRRRDQARTRSRLPVLEPGEKLRINPLAGWTRSDVWRFIVDRGLPYNPLHDRGYASIGDAPLTAPVHGGAHERAGRWPGGPREECGIHAA